LVWQLRMEIAEAREAVSKGRSTMMLAAFGPHIQDVPSNDPRLAQALEAAEESLDWVNSRARKDPRPYKAVFEPGSAMEELRERIGPASFDALALAEAGVGALYADDLGLRRYTIGGGQRVDSFSSVSLLHALASKGSLASAARDRHLADLTLGGFAFIPPSEGTLDEAIRRMPGLGSDGFARLLSPLGGPLVTAYEAGALAAHAVRTAATATIQTVAVELVAETAIRAMANRWHQAVAARLVQQHSERELRLLHPQYLKGVTRICTQLAAASVATIGPGE